MKIFLLRNCQLQSSHIFGSIKTTFGYSNREDIVKQRLLKSNTLLEREHKGQSAEFSTVVDVKFLEKLLKERNLESFFAHYNEIVAARSEYNFTDRDLARLSADAHFYNGDHDAVFQCSKKLHDLGEIYDHHFLNARSHTFIGNYDLAYNALANALNNTLYRDKWKLRELADLSIDLLVLTNDSKREIFDFSNPIYSRDDYIPWLKWAEAIDTNAQLTHFLISWSSSPNRINDVSYFFETVCAVSQAAVLLGNYNLAQSIWEEAIIAILKLRRSKTKFKIGKSNSIQSGRKVIEDLYACVDPANIQVFLWGKLLSSYTSGSKLVGADKCFEFAMFDRDLEQDTRDRIDRSPALMLKTCHAGGHIKFSHCNGYKGVIFLLQKQEYPLCNLERVSFMDSNCIIPSNADNVMSIVPERVDPLKENTEQLNELFRTIANNNIGDAIRILENMNYDACNHFFCSTKDLLKRTKVK